MGTEFFAPNVDEPSTAVDIHEVTRRLNAALGATLVALWRVAHTRKLPTAGRGTAGLYPTQRRRAVSTGCRRRGLLPGFRPGAAVSGIFRGTVMVLLLTTAAFPTI